MEIEYIEETAKFVGDLTLSDRSIIDRVIEYVEKNGLGVGPKYIKKILNVGIWELRAGKVRLFLYKKDSFLICVHAIYKKSQKIKKEDIRLAERRSRLFI